MKRILITITEQGSVNSNFTGCHLYEALGALEMTRDLVLQTIRRTQQMYSPEDPTTPIDSPDTNPNINTTN